MSKEDKRIETVVSIMVILPAHAGTQTIHHRTAIVRQLSKTTILKTITAIAAVKTMSTMIITMAMKLMRRLKMAPILLTVDYYNYTQAIDPTPWMLR